MFYLGWMAILFMNIHRDQRAVWLRGTTFGGGFRPIAVVAVCDLTAANLT
jgi:hypothetical protein